MWFPHGRAYQLVVSTTWSALKTYVQETFRQTPQVIYIPLYNIYIYILHTATINEKKDCELEEKRGTVHGRV